LITISDSIFFGFSHVCCQDSDGDGLSDDYEGYLGRYQIIKTDAAISWTDASANATQKHNQYNVQGHLVTITDTWEMMKLKELFKTELSSSQNRALPPSQVACWIGLVKPAGRDSYEWVTHESLSYTDWSPNEPSLTEADQYALVSSSIWRSSARMAAPSHATGVVPRPYNRF